MSNLERALIQEFTDALNKKLNFLFYQVKELEKKDVAM